MEHRRRPPRGTPSLRATLLLLLAVAALFLVGGIPLQILLGEPGLLLSQILFLLAPALVFLQAGGYDRDRTLSLRPPGGRQAGFAFLFLLGGTGMAWFLAWAQSFVIPVPVEYLEAMEEVLTADTLSRFLWLLVLVALAPAVVEETLFRGVLLSGFRGRLPDVWAVVATGLVFGLFHLAPDTAFRVLPTAWLGMVLGWVVVATGSLPLAVFLHFLNNGTILALTALPATREVFALAEWEPPLFLLPGALALLALGAYGMHLTRPSEPELNLRTEGMP